MSQFFRPYEGRKPYVFISYSHRNSERVLEILKQLDQKKLRLWYDEGIPAGSDWPQNIADHMENAAAVIFFRSATALASPNCRAEIEAAVQKEKPLLVLPLDDSAPDDSWKGLLPSEKAQEKSVSDTVKVSDPVNAGSEQLADSVRSWQVLGRGFYKTAAEKIRFDLIGLVLAMLLLLTAVGGLVGIVSGVFDPWINSETEITEAAQTEETTTEVPTEKEEILPSEYEGLFPVKFPDILQDRAFHTALGKKKKDDVLQSELSQVVSLYFCGSLYTNSADSIVFTKDVCSAGGTAAGEGSVSDLSVIGISTHLTSLYLIRQTLSDLSGLEKLVLLEELHLGGCTELDDLASLPRLPSLSVLHLEHGNVRDLSPLAMQPALKTVTVSADMLPLTLPENAGFVVELKP